MSMQAMPPINERSVNHPTRLSRLPVEILELIALKVAADFLSLAKSEPFSSLHGMKKEARITAFQDIKTIRLIDWNFAVLKTPKRILFHKLRFYALPKHVELLQQTKLGSIAPYITTVEFSAFPFGPTITEQEFADRILTTSSMSMDYSDDDLHDSYLRFQQLAIKMRELLDGTDLHNLWIESLKSLPNLRHIALESPIRVESENSQVRSVGIEYRPNVLLDALYFDDALLWDSCPMVFEDEVARNGNILLATAVKCLARASISPSTLTICSEHTCDFHWELIPEWSNFDLTNVVDLQYHGLYRKGGSESTHASSSSQDSSLQALLSRVSNSVQSVALKNASRQAFTWHDHSPYLQPHLKFLWLRHFSLVDGYVDAYRFADFISKQDRLERLYLEDVWPNDYDRGAWKLVFSVLRERSLQIEIFDAYVNREARENSGSTFSVCAAAKATLNTAPFHSTDFDDERSTKIFEKDLEAYIEGKCDWTSVLEDRFLRDDDVNMV